MSMTKCPACGRGAANVYRCNRCGDIRCGFSGCKGTNGGAPFSAYKNGNCRACMKGKYEGPL